MWVRQIELHKWRRFRNRVKVADLSSRLNIIHGPNEAGKSTLIAAMGRLLFDRSRSRSRTAMEIQPWGSNVAPIGALVFETKGRRYRIEKLFHPTRGHSTLQLWKEDHWFDKTDDEEEIHELVHKLVGGTTARHGSSSLTQWGLLRLLWALQDHAVVPDGLDLDLHRRLEPVLGSRSHSIPAETQRIVEEVERRFDLYYTKERQTLRRGNPLLKLEEQEKKLLEEAGNLRNQLEQSRHLSERIQDEIAEQEEDSLRFQELEEKLRELRQKRDNYRELEIQRSIAQEKVSSLESQVTKKKALLQQIQDAAAEEEIARELGKQTRQHLAELEEREAELSQEAETCRKLELEAKRRFDECSQKLDQGKRQHEKLSDLLALSKQLRETRSKEKKAEERVRLAEATYSEHLGKEETTEKIAEQADADAHQSQLAAEEAQRQLDTANLLEKRRNLLDELAKIREADHAIEGHLARRRQIRAAPESVLDDLRKIEKKRVSAKAKLEAERVVLTFLATRSLEATIRADEDSFHIRLEPGMEQTFEGIRLELELPGLGKIRVERPAKSRRASQELAALDMEYRQKLANYGAESLEQLREASRKCRALDQEIGLLRKVRKQHRNENQIEEELKHLPHQGPSVETAEQNLIVAKEEQAARRQQSAKAKKQLEALRKEVLRARNHLQKRREHLNGIRGRLQILEEQLEAKSKFAAISDTNLEKLEQTILKSSLALQDARIRLEEEKRSHHRAQGLCAAAEQKLRHVKDEKLGTKASLENHRDSERQAQRKRLLHMAGKGKEELRRDLYDAESKEEKALKKLHRLPELPRNPASELQELEEEYRELQGFRDERLRKQTVLEGELNQLNHQGLYQRLAEVEEKLKLRQQEIQTERLKQSAIRRLKGLIDIAREEFQRELGGPIREWVSIRAREVLGEQISEVRFDKDLRIHQVKDRVSKTKVDIQMLSRGARDQLGLLVRLGMAVQISKEERHLVVLDDVLVHADSSRRRKLLQLLKETAKQVQILICTCHQEHYAGLGEAARRIDLETLQW